jgi:adenylosuccinate synthase
VVLKVNGGANSGHTAGGIKLNLLPAGVVVRDAGHLCIGSGVVADPRKICVGGQAARGEGPRGSFPAAD